MPGHVKKTEGPDPCPDQWLIVSDELKVKLKSKPYDPKKSVWVPDKATGGYFEGLLDSIDGEKASVKLIETGDVSIHCVVCILQQLLSRSLLFEILKEQNKCNGVKCGSKTSLPVTVNDGVDAGVDN